MPAPTVFSRAECLRLVTTGRLGLGARRRGRDVKGDSRRHRAGQGECTAVDALCPLGFARMMASTKANRLSWICWSVKLLRADAEVNQPGAVVAELDAAALQLPNDAGRCLRRCGRRCRSAGSASSRGDRGSGRDHRPCPSDRPSRWRRRTRASRPESAGRTRRPRRSRRRPRARPARLRPAAKTSTRTTLPVPCGSTTVERTD